MPARPCPLPVFTPKARPMGPRTATLEATLGGQIPLS